MRTLFIILVVLNLLVFASIWVAEAPSPGAAARSPHVAGGERLQLLGETDGYRQHQAQRSLPASPAPATAEGDQAMCTMVGPFAQLLQAEYLVDRLVSMDVSAVIRTLEVPDGVRHLVYLPPEVSEAAALRRLHEVQARRIDSYMIASGDLANGISLGIYTERADAEARLREIRDLGYQPAVREQARTISEIWVSLPAAEGESIDSRLWMDLLRQQAGLEKRQNFCPGVAPQ